MKTQNNKNEPDNEKSLGSTSCSLSEIMPPEMAEYLNKEKARLKIQDEFVEEAKRKIEEYNKSEIRPT